MFEMDRWLSAITRRFVRRRGLRRKMTHYLRRKYARHYRDAPDPDVLIRNFDGDLKMKLDRACSIGSRIYWEDSHWRGEVRAFKRLLTPETVCVDVGANQGEFTLVAAKRLVNGAVLAFEPVPRIFARLQQNVEMNGFRNVRLFDVGLGEESGKAEMFLDGSASEGDYRNDRLASLHRGASGGERLGQVRIERFDKIFEETGLQRLDVMKIDVEGAELAVLRGAGETLSRYRPALIMEINEETARAAGYSSKEVIGLLTPLGYRLFRIRRGKGRTEPIAAADLPPFCNVLCRVE